MILRRISGSRFSEVYAELEYASCLILGGGPSLTIPQVNYANFHLSESDGAIAVNDSYLLAPWADICYASDPLWHQWHQQGVAKKRLGLTAQDVAERWASFKGQKCAIQLHGLQLDESIHVLRNKHYPGRGYGLSLNPEELVTGFNSGFQAINLAVLAGAKRIILLGFDGAPSEAGESHWHGKHPKPTPAAAYELYRRSMSEASHAILEAGVQVINCSPGSKIDCFEKAELESVL